MRSSWMSVDEAKVPQVEQLEAERVNAEAYGQTDRVEQIDRQLADLGVKKRAAQERKAAAEDKSEKAEKPAEPKRSAPAGRTDRPQREHG